MLQNKRFRRAGFYLLKNLVYLTFFFFFLLPSLLFPRVPEQTDGNQRSAYISYLSGSVYLQRASALDLEEASLHLPLLEGDRIATGQGRVEISLGQGKTIWLDEATKLDLEKLPGSDSPYFELRLVKGTITLCLTHLDQEKQVEIRTPDFYLLVLEKGLYRVSIQEKKETSCRIFEGLAEIQGRERARLLRSGQLLRVKAGQLVPEIEKMDKKNIDAFDNWCSERISFLKKVNRRGAWPHEKRIMRNK